MGVTETNQIAIHSSIALLQERFKQLHREKRQREERELLKLFSDHSPDVSFSTPTHSTRNYIDRTNKRRKQFHSGTLLTDIQPPKVSLSLWPSTSTTTDCHTDLLLEADQAPATKRMQTEDRLTMRNSSSCLFGNDVDTSLRL